MMKLNKQHITIGLLAVSLLGNLFQFVSARDERGYAQLGRNLVASELAKSEVASKGQMGSSCQFVGALRVFPVGVLTCSPEKIWERARCDTKGLVTKEDFGMILVCDGASWREAAADLREPWPGDACNKEGETVLLLGGDGITCTGGKYVVTMIGPSHSVGAPCFGPTGADVKPDKFGMVCRDGKFQRAKS